MNSSNVFRYRIVQNVKRRIRYILNRIVHGQFVVYVIAMTYTWRKLLVMLWWCGAEFINADFGGVISKVGPL